MAFSWTITLTDAKFTELMTGLNAILDRDAEDIDLTDEQFFKKWVKKEIKHAYKTGKRKLALDSLTVNVDEDII